MTQITSYDALAAFAAGLKAGDTLTIGSAAVAPAMLDTLTALSLTFPLTVATSTTVQDPASTTVTGTATLFGIADLGTTLVFVPQDPAVTSGPFLMSVAASPGSATRWDLASSFAVTDMALAFAPAHAIPTYTATIGCDLVIGTTNRLTLPVSIALPTYPGLDWTATGNFAQQPITADAFAALADGMTLSSFLPAPLDTLAQFGLTETVIAFSPSGGLTSAYFVVAYTAPFSALGIIEIPANGVSLRFMVETSKTAASYVELDAQFDIATVPVDIGAHFAPGDFQLWGRLQQGKSVDITAMFAHFNVTLPSGFPQIDIERLSLLADLSAETYSFDFGASITVGSVLKLDHLSASVAVSTTPTTTVAADFTGTILFAEGAAIFLEAKYDGDGSGLTLTGAATDLQIGTLIAYWAQRFGIDAVPEPIASLKLDTLNVSYNTATGDFHFACVGGFTVYDTAVVVTFTVDLTHTATGRAAPPGAIAGTAGYSVKFGGSVQFADLIFAIQFDHTDLGNNTFVADFTGSDSSTISVHDLVAAVSVDLASPIPTDLTIGITAVKFAWVSGKPSQFLFGVELGASISLADVPLIGDKLPADAIVKFDDLQFLYASTAFTADQCAAINALLPPAVANLPADGLADGVLISGELQLGATHHAIALPIGGSKTQVAVALGATNTAAATSLSINVQKQFGPIAIQKLGLLYDNQRLFVTGDIVLDAKLLSIGLIELGIGSKITEFSPAVTLSGLTIGIDDGPLQVRGGLLGSIDPLDFYGALSITMPSLSIGALGGYAQLGSDPSFFLYVAVNRPLFGYPFFYLDGLAGGIGFNRDLILPDIDGVAGFPLVAWATGGGAPPADPGGDIAGQIATVITTLKDSIPPRVGEYWVAAGLNFSSFGVLHSFALLTVAFGTEFKIALLGLTTASLPPNAGEGIPVIGYVEMALLVTFSPTAGILQVAAKLTPASYILTSDCHLTGGFAYYSWFKDDPSGDPASYHAGDFVVTLGGYNPAFAVPAYYPSEPLLGLDWRVDGNTSIKGGIYFALTPSAMMAGGRLEAVWQDGNLRAWFIAHADFLLSWKPFYYLIDIGLGIGVSFKVDLWFTSFTVSLSIGVNLTLWGPPFGGRIDVDLSLISFTVWIGNRHNPDPQAIPWTDFKTSFLPAPSTGLATRADAGTPIATDSYCHSSVSKGLVQDLTASTIAGAPDWIVNAETLELVTFTAIPAKAATLLTAVTHSQALPVGANDFGLGPVAVGIADLQSTHAITIDLLTEGQPDPNFDFATYAVVTPILANVSAAAWGGALVVAPSISTINAAPAMIAGVCIGYTIRTVAPTPDHTPLPIVIAVLEEEIDGVVDFAWTKPTVPTTDPFDQSTAMATFAATLVSTAPARAATIAALNALGLGLDPHVDIDALAAEAATTLLHAPDLAYLGEYRAA